MGLIPRRFVKVRDLRCQAGFSLGVLGRKWALPILGDIAIYGVDRFNSLLKSVSGISPKVLSLQLHHLEREGLIQKVETHRYPKLVRWGLTERGLDVFPILMWVTAYQSKWNPEQIHPGRRSMKLHEIFDREAMRLIERAL